MNNRAVAVINDNTVSAQYVSRNDEQLRFVEGEGAAAEQGREAPPYRTLTVEDYGIAFRKGDDLVSEVNDALAPIKVKGHEKAAARERAGDLLERVGLEGQTGSDPSQLSGGQQRRVAIARALAIDPQVMLFDEVTSAPDPEPVGEVLEVMRDRADEGMTMMVLSHEMGFAREVGDTITPMADGEIVERTPPDRFLDEPTTESGRRFLSKLL